MGNADLRPKKRQKTYIVAVGLLVGTDKLLFKCFREEGEHILSLNDKTIETRKAKHLAFGEIKMKGNDQLEIKMDHYHLRFRFSSSKHSSCHINMRVSYFSEREFEAPHGVLGQTADRNREWKTMESHHPQGESIIEGKMEDYIVGNLFDPHFTFSRYLDNIEMMKKIKEKESREERIKMEAGGW